LAICLISFVGRSLRQNQLRASGNGSSVSCPGLCRCHTTRKSSEAQICPRPAGSVCQLAPESSSRSTNWPALKPEALATVIEDAPLAASAVGLVALPELLLYCAGRMMTSGEGLGPVFSWPGWAPPVFCSVV